MSISVSNNPDGSFTVSCGTETVIVGAPTAPKAGAPVNKRGHHGGFVVTSIAPSTKLPPDIETALDTKELILKLKAASSRAGIKASAGKGSLPEAHFHLKGAHTLDVAKLTKSIGGENPTILAHIHWDADHG